VLFLTVFWNVVTPVFLVAALGVVLQRTVVVDPRSLSRAVFYVFSPCLAFAGLYTMHLDGDSVVDMVLLALLMAGFMALAGIVISYLRGHGRLRTSATVLTLMANNNGNYGLPLNEFAFGLPGLQFALLYFVLNAVLNNTVGVYVASAGQASAGQALRNVSRTPLVYATLLALVWNRMQWPIPGPIMKAISLSADAAVPVMLLILGIHLGRLGRNLHWRQILWVTMTKLLVAPVAAWVIAGWLGMTGLERAVGVVQASMPTAVLTTVLSTEFDCEPEYVAEIVFATTLASVVTLTTVVTLLKGWLSV